MSCCGDLHQLRRLHQLFVFVSEERLGFVFSVLEVFQRSGGLGLKGESAVSAEPESISVSAMQPDPQICFE